MRYHRPVGTGFSQGKPTATSEKDIAEQFLGFFRNFVELFDLQGKKIYIAGESYAGYYVPYIADAMHAKKDKKLYNIQDILVWDPSINEDAILQQGKQSPQLLFWHVKRITHYRQCLLCHLLIIGAISSL